MGFFISYLYLLKTEIMPKIVRLTESDLQKIVRRVITEQTKVDDSCLKKLDLDFFENFIDDSTGRKNYSYYYGKYKGVPHSFYIDGVVQVYEIGKDNEKFGKWECKNGELVITLDNKPGTPSTNFRRKSNRRSQTEKMIYDTVKELIPSSGKVTAELYFDEGEEKDIMGKIGNTKFLLVRAEPRSEFDKDI